MVKSYDCAGWATKANMLCSDGRTIRKNAFEGCDGKEVPVVWNHEHNDPNAVLGHAILENRDDGVYAYISFNDNESGRVAKELVKHKDVDRLSIWANKLKQMGGDVIHGVIREVSLVLAGANPGAVIDTVIAHSDDSDEEAIISCGEHIELNGSLEHSDEGTKGEEKVAEEAKKQDENKDETIDEVLNTLTDKQKKAVAVIVGMVIKDFKAEVKHSDDPAPEEDPVDKEKPIGEVLDTLTAEQKAAVDVIVGMACEEAGTADDNTDGNEGGNNTMKHNIFDQETDTQGQEPEVLSHSEFMEIMNEAKRRNGSVKDTFISHGITNIDYLFPDAQKLNNVPGFIKRDTTWVDKVMQAVHKTPFSRIKSVFADITEDTARAKGYIKGNQKKDEVFKMLRRTTTAVTVYKHQTLDRDDTVDITEFDVIAWLKGEMRLMLDEELARAFLFGDGRGGSDQDKINEQNIRPIWTDEDVYTIKSEIQISKSTTTDEKAAAFIKASIKSRKNYKGTGNPTMFMSEDMLTDCLLLEDKMGRPLYDTIEKLATKLRVKEIVSVPVMDGLSRVKGSNTHFLAGLYVNLTDYNVGADKGGAVNMFDDFDIDYNRQKYLIETRCSGAMVVPYGAVAIEFVIPTSEVQEAA